MKWLSHVLGLALAIAVGTWLLAWWWVPVAGALYGVAAARRRGAVLAAALAGAGGWGVLLAYAAATGPVGSLTELFGAVFRMSGVTLVVLTIAYAAFLAATAAACARGLRRLLTPAAPAGV
jgi:hypothetical protein